MSRRTRNSGGAKSVDGDSVTSPTSVHHDGNAQEMTDSGEHAPQVKQEKVKKHTAVTEKDEEEGKEHNAVTKEDQKATEEDRPMTDAGDDDKDGDDGVKQAAGEEHEDATKGDAEMIDAGEHQEQNGGTKHDGATGQDTATEDPKTPKLPSEIDEVERASEFPETPTPTKMPDNSSKDTSHDEQVMPPPAPQPELTTPKHTNPVNPYFGRRGPLSDLTDEEVDEDWFKPFGIPAPPGFVRPCYPRSSKDPLYNWEAAQVYTVHSTADNQAQPQTQPTPSRRAVPPHVTTKPSYQAPSWVAQREERGEGVQQPLQSRLASPAPSTVPSTEVPEEVGDGTNKQRSVSPATSNNQPLPTHHDGDGVDKRRSVTPTSHSLRSRAAPAKK